MKKTVAVFFGGPSCEHDVSVLTGLQALEALDTTKYDSFPVYVALDGRWYVGDALRDRKNYIPSPAIIQQLDAVSLPLGTAQVGGRPKLVSSKPLGFLSRTVAEYPFDIALPAFHGTNGEDGAFQGVLRWLGVPFVGCDVLPASVFMDKRVSKYIFQVLNLPHLPYLSLNRGDSLDNLEAKLTILNFPLCVKPCNLGSSVGVSKANNVEELKSAILKVFAMDRKVMIEPYVDRLVEYNVAVSRAFGETRISAIERPLRKDEVLNFKDKYLSGGGANKFGGGNKLMGSDNAGMHTAVRVLNPEELGDTRLKAMEHAAKSLADSMDLTGTIRIDFLAQEHTNDIWVNELNTFPGSMSYFLWEAAEKKVRFPDLLNYLIDEATHRMTLGVFDPVQAGSAIFKR